MNNPDLSTLQDEQKQQVEAILSVLEYLDQIEKNRHVIEQDYLEQKIGDATQQLDALMNGIAWLEYTVVLLHINMDADFKNRLFEGLKEAMESHDWLTIADFLSFQLVQYIEHMRKAFSQKYLELTGSSYE